MGFEDQNPRDLVVNNDFWQEGRREGQTSAPGPPDVLECFIAVKVSDVTSFYNCLSFTGKSV